MIIGSLPPLWSAFEKFAGFFHDRQVGGELGVEDIIEAELAKGGDQFAFHVPARLEAERLADGGPHGRGELGHLDPRLGSLRASNNSCV